MALRANQVSTQSRPRFDAYIYPGTELGTGDAQIRLLEVLPGKGDDPVRCNLRSVIFNAIYDVDALSYTWGLPPATNTIFINSSPFQVRINLLTALLHLRQPSSTILLWIDAICINQSNMDERNHQAQQMANIYRLARRVLVWFGVESKDSREAFSFLSDAYLRSPYNRKELMDDSRWAALTELCKFQYWRRVWIVQEICLASRAVICCGRQQIPWNYLSELRKARKHIWPQYLSVGERDFMRSHPARPDHQKEARSKGGCVLWTLLERFKDLLCQEVPDKIYGFMGLSTDCGSQGIKVDYSKSVNQVYGDVIYFYHDKFKRDSSSHHAAQLMKLSEFLQTLHGNHPGSSQVMENIKRDEKLLSTRDPVIPSADVSISACSVMTISSFPSSDDGIAEEYRISELIDYYDGKIPYSHLGYWRDLVDSGSKDVSKIENPAAYATFKYRNPLASCPEIDHPSVFLATQIINGVPAIYADYKTPYVVGIAPSGSQTGDIVMNFVDSRVALVMRRFPSDISISPQPGKSPEEDKYILTGRGCMFLSENTFPFRSQLTTEKEVEILKNPSLPSESNMVDDHFPAILSIHLSTLRLVTTPNTHQLSSGFNKPTLDLFPDEGSERDKSKDIYAHKLQKPVDDAKLLEMQQNPEKKRYALGPGYTAITNPGNIGYAISSFQILYMMKPFRTAVLSSEDAPDQAMLIELRKLFWKLHTSHLPADPLSLTESFGWGVGQINEAQDFLEFWRKFTERMERTALGEDAMSFMVGKMRSFYKESGNIRDESFYDLSVNAVGNYRLNHAFDDFFAVRDVSEIATTLIQLPPVLILCTKFFQYDFATDQMTTDTGTFKYPSELDLANYAEPEITDTVYQLHGVAVLEEVKPVSRYLLYLRPNIEDQWILFFKETVSYAQRSEVFEDNFRLDNEKTRNAPLRTPYVLVYILKSKLDVFLG